MRKGFTLVELLAVIVILAVIATITTTVVINVKNELDAQTEFKNAKTLVKLANDYTTIKEMEEDETTTDEQIFIIEDNVEYTLDKNGVRTRTNELVYKGKICDYCIIKISPEKDVFILYEGKNRDYKKEYNSKKIEEIKLIESRDIISKYNEIDLLLNLYLANNDLDSIKYFSLRDNKMYEINSDGTELEVFSLNKSNIRGRIKLTDSKNYDITLIEDDNSIQFISNGEIIKNDNINTEYSDSLMFFYDSLKSNTDKYLNQNTISNDMYYEFNNGVINQIDKYGNIVAENAIPLDNNFKFSGEILINSNKEVSFIIYDNNKIIKKNFDSEKLTDEILNYNIDSYILFKNFGRLELLAETYLNGANSSNYRPTQSDWLVFYYIRSLKYNSSLYDIVTGKDTNFITYVTNNASYLETYFKNKSTYSPNENKIDLKHMAASIAGSMYNTDSIYNILYEELEYDSVVSWAGDLHTLMENSILKSGVKEKYGSYYNATYSLLGNEGTSFGMQDMYSDIDAWNLYYNLIENTNLSIQEVLQQYYSGKGTRSYKNRFTSFISIMNNIADDFNTNYVNFAGVVNHFTDTDENWQTIDSLEITPTNAEQKEIGDAFVKWIEDKAAQE